MTSSLKCDTCWSVGTNSLFPEAAVNHIMKDIIGCRMASSITITINLLMKWTKLCMSGQARVIITDIPQNVAAKPQKHIVIIGSLCAHQMQRGFHCLSRPTQSDTFLYGTFWQGRWQLYPLPRIFRMKFRWNFLDFSKSYNHLEVKFLKFLPIFSKGWCKPGARFCLVVVCT